MNLVEIDSVSLQRAAPRFLEVASFPTSKVHLARELWLEGTDLEIEGDERLEESVIEEEVDEILLFPQGDAVLPADEAKAVAEFKEEGLQA